MKISYELLFSKSVEVESKLLSAKIISSPLVGRFKEHQKKVESLAILWRKKMTEKIDSEFDFGGLEVVALKELRELVEVLEPILHIYDDLPAGSKKIVKEKINEILLGPTYIMEEGKNTKARNFLFEFRIAAKLIEAKYHVLFFDNPDLAVTEKGRRYAIECKRITGDSGRAIKDNIESAIDQLIAHKSYFYAGVVALDVSSLLDKRENLLSGTDRDAANEKVLDDIEAMLRKDIERYEKLKRYSYSHLVALIYNFSLSYVIPREVGWSQGTGVMVFNEENPHKAKHFLSDFERFKRNSKLV